MSLWRSHKPTVAKVHGYAVAGGSDIALCCDLVVMAEDAKIGYPPARVWGVPTTAMWVHRVGAEKAKRMLFTGDVISGGEAKAMGLVCDAVPGIVASRCGGRVVREPVRDAAASELDETCARLLRRISSVPKNQLMMCKLLCNQVPPRPVCTLWWRDVVGAAAAATGRIDSGY